MSNKKANCLSTNIPTVDETLLECDSFVLTKCVLEDGKTQEEINKELRNQIDTLYRIIKNITK